MGRRRSAPWLGWRALAVSYVGLALVHPSGIGFATAFAQVPAPPAEAEAAELDADALRHDPARLRRIAEARLERGDGPGAVEALERFLTVVPDAPDAEAVRARIEALEHAPSTLEVISTPPGARVRLDGQPVGETPVRVEVAAGVHPLQLCRAGYRLVGQRLVVAYASRRTVEITLEPEPTTTDERVDSEAWIETAPSVAEATEGGERRVGPAVWATSGVAAGALIAGTVFGFLALEEESEFDLRPSEARADRGERDALVADICFGVAAASAITALVLWLRPRPALSLPFARGAVAKGRISLERF